MVEQAVIEKTFKLCNYYLDRDMSSVYVEMEALFDPVSERGRYYVTMLSVVSWKNLVEQPRWDSFLLHITKDFSSLIDGRYQECGTKLSELVSHLPSSRTHSK